jgi:hypothetical protein
VRGARAFRDGDARDRQQGASVMGYRTRGGKVVRVGKLTLYHFTPPYNLPDILRDGIVPQTRDGNAHMLPGVEAVWLTADPQGNTITEAHLMRREGDEAFLAEYAAGRRLLFGCNEYGSARLTIETRESPHLQNYLKLLRFNYAVTDPDVLAQWIEMIPRIEDWWVSSTIVAPDCITEVCPVGDETTHYNEIVEQIARAAGGENQYEPG